MSGFKFIRGKRSLKVTSIMGLKKEGRGQSVGISSSGSISSSRSIIGSSSIAIVMITIQ